MCGKKILLAIYISLFSIGLIFSATTVTAPTYTLGAGDVSGYSVVAPLGDPAISDGNISSGEWTDAKKIRIGTDEWYGYVYVKHDDTYLYVLLDHVSDTIKHPMGWDNGWVAIDTTHDRGMEPDDDDLLFHSSGHVLLIGDTPYQYNGSQWAPLMTMGEEVNMTEHMEHMFNLTYGWIAAGQGSQGTSPNSETPHTIFEFRIPLAIVEGKDRFGFYVVMQDLDTPRIIDWPEVNGTDPDFWPTPEGGGPFGNLTSPNDWGTLILGTVGVKVGDWVGYGDVSFEWASNMTGQEPPQGMNVSWVDVEVLDVSNSNVTVRSTTIYKNGTEQRDVMSGNVATGEGNLSVGVIPSNLGPGDEIPANLTWYNGEPLRLVINGTVTRSYAGANREVNYVNITYPIIYDNVTLGAWNMSFYWDKKTGAMCEEVISYTMLFTVNSTHYYMNMSMLWRITATNMWPAVFPIDWNGYAFNVTMISNSTISNFNFSQPDMQISFNVTGPAGKAGYCNVSIPDGLLWGNFSVYMDGFPLEEGVDYIKTYNGTHYIFYITYNHTTHTIAIRGTEVIPEFPSAMILLLLMVATTVSVILYGRRRRRT